MGPDAPKKDYAKPGKKYSHSSIKKRIEALFLDNIGRIVTRELILEVARNPKTGKVPENWHQRLSELRTDDGYAILSWRNQGYLRVSEYLMPSKEKRKSASGRVKPTGEAWQSVLERANYCCEWHEGNDRCGLRQGEKDPVGGGTVRLTADHKTPHSVNPDADPNDPSRWQALCGRHQIVKKNYWDDSTGWLNVQAIVQASSRQEKKQVYDFLKSFFGDE